MNGKVLIVDDEPDIRELLELTLGRMALETACAADLQSARDLLDHHPFDLCLTDMRLPDGDGLDLVHYIQRQHSDMPVAVITAQGSTETAIKALKNGAFDFVSKPVDLQKLRDLVQSALQLRQPMQSPASSHRSNQENPTAPRIIGNSERIHQLNAQIGKLARSQAPVHISGESGSGKELAARAIHAQSSRAQGPFVALNCGAIPAELIESEVFGHTKGAFTGADQDQQGLFQSAHRGTLFLDEIADMPLHTQVKLLRAIQEKSIRPVGSQHEVSIDVRILSATHRNLAAEVAAGRFRQDLYYRINVIELLVPPLRERRDDIEQLTDHILERIYRDNQAQRCHLSAAALTVLKQYDFPGNVRELENILQRAATLCENQTIEPDQLDLSRSRGVSPVVEPAISMPAHSGQSSPAEDEPQPFSLEKHLEAIEIEAIEKALAETRWNKTKAAEKLGMSFRSLRYRLKKLGLE